MPFCANCGTELEQGDRCPRCAGGLKTHGVRLAEEECVVKEYRATTLARPKADGFLVVTNRRLLFIGEGRAMAGRSILIREVHLPDVSGITSYYGKGLSIAYLIFAAAAIMVIIGIAHASSLLYALLILPAWLIWWALTKHGRTILLIVHSRAMDQSPVAVVATESRFSLLGRHAARAVAASPGPDAEVMVSEIGALVLDLQTRGNLAVEAWRHVEAIG